MALVALASLASWHYPMPGPKPGLDNSWQAALHMGARHGIPFGKDLVFTYGPLGFLGFPTPWYTPTAVLAFLFVAAVHVALVATAFLCARRRFGPVPSAVFAFLIGCTVSLETPELSLILLAFWLLLAVQAEPTERLARWAAPACGVLVGVSLLMKLNSGFVGLALLAVTAWWLPPGGWRSVLRAAAAAGSVFCVGYLVTGNGPSDIVPYFSNALQIAAGYSDAMWRRAPSAAWQLPLAGVLAVLVAVTVLTGATRRRAVVAVIAFVLLWAEFRQAFTRHETGRVLAFFAAVTIIAASLPHRGRWRALAAFVVVAGIVAPIAQEGAHTLNAFSHASTAVTGAVNLALPSRRHSLIERGRARIRAKTGFDAAAAEAVAGHTVHVDPYEASVAWLLEGTSDWRPAPVFQAYSAYTTPLDRLNARTLSDAREAPERIVRLKRSIIIDSRSPEFDAPAHTLAMLCHYRVELASPAYEVLARAPDRCGPQRQVATVDVASGRSVPIPLPTQPNEAILAKVFVHRTVAERLQSMFYRPTRLSIVVLDGIPYRLVEATAADLAVLRAPLGTRPVSRFDDPVDHGLLGFDHVSGSVHVEFYAMHVDP